MVSVHTSPLEQPGTGDAGGMNVYVLELATRMGARGVQVEIFTRATEAGADPVVEHAPGVIVRHVVAGPLQGLAKNDLPGQLCAFAAGLMRTEARQDPDWYHVLHTHYWLSGQVGWLAADRWHVPLVHTMHTMGKVKNAHLAAGDTPEPATRIIGEEQVVSEADRLIANTTSERDELVTLYDADPDLVAVVPPGVDLDRFTPNDASEAEPTPADGQRAARARLGVPDDALMLLFVGRIQPLKAPDVLVRAAADMLSRNPSLRGRLVVAVVGGPSGSGLEHPEELSDLARSLGLIDVPGVEDVIRFNPPVPRDELPTWYRAADLTVVPSHNESFGLVAIESQACGTPVVAAHVGGLTSAVADGRSGVLVPGHDPRAWSVVLARLLADPERRARLAEGALAHAVGFGWDVTVDKTLEVYRGARAERLGRLLAQGRFQ